VKKAAIAYIWSIHTNACIALCVTQYMLRFCRRSVGVYILRFCRRSVGKEVGSDIGRFE